MWDLHTATQKAMKYVIQQREKAPRCTICNDLLFDCEDALTTFMFVHSLQGNDISADMRTPIALYMNEHYPFNDKRGVVKHHLSYKKDISIFVCTDCHGKIHNYDDPEYAKWKPVDKRPKKNYHKLGKKVIKPID